MVWFNANLRICLDDTSTLNISYIRVRAFVRKESSNVGIFVIVLFSGNVTLSVVDRNFLHSRQRRSSCQSISRAFLPPTPHPPQLARCPFFATPLCPVGNPTYPLSRVAEPASLLQVLLGLPYDGAIDIWSLGCISIELFLGLPIFPGVSDHNQICRIVEMTGSLPEFMLENGKDTLKFFKRVRLISGGGRL